MTGNLPTSVKQALEQYWYALGHYKGLVAENGHTEGLVEAKQTLDLCFENLMKTMEKSSSK